MKWGVCIVHTLVEELCLRDCPKLLCLENLGVWSVKWGPLPTGKGPGRHHQDSRRGEQPRKVSNTYADSRCKEPAFVKLQGLGRFAVAGYWLSGEGGRVGECEPDCHLTGDDIRDVLRQLDCSSSIPENLPASNWRMRCFSRKFLGQRQSLLGEPY